jgi:hypothetical protein
MAFEAFRRVGILVEWDGMHRGRHADSEERKKRSAEPYSKAHSSATATCGCKAKLFAMSELNHKPTNSASCSLTRLESEAGSKLKPAVAG